ncbi:MAG: nuclear transport factor 2 family protein, partial [Pseudomonadota bacterium]
PLPGRPSETYMKTRRIKLPLTASFVQIAAATMVSALFFTSEAAAKDEVRVEAVKAAEMARFKANVDADAAALGKLLDDDLDYVHSNGDHDTKASFIESLTSGRRDYVSMTCDMQLVRVFGNVATIRGTAKVTVVSNGNSQDLDIGYTDTWLWKDKRWQMTAWHSSRYLPAAPAAK